MEQISGIEGIIPPRERLEIVVDAIFASNALYDNELFEMEETKDLDDLGNPEGDGGAWQRAIILHEPDNAMIMLHRHVNGEGITDLHEVIGIKPETMAMIGIGWLPSDETPPRLFDETGVSDARIDDSLVAALPHWITALTEQDNVLPDNPFEALFDAQELTYTDDLLTRMRQVDAAGYTAARLEIDVKTMMNFS